MKPFPELQKSRNLESLSREIKMMFLPYQMRQALRAPGPCSVKWSIDPSAAHLEFL